MKRKCRATDIPRGARIEGLGKFNGSIVQDVKIHYDEGVMFVTIKTSVGEMMKHGHDILEIDENTPERMARLAKARQILGMGGLL